MPTQEPSVPQFPTSSNWNVVRSKSVPSGVSGSHMVAVLYSSTANDTSMLNRNDPVISSKLRPKTDVEPVNAPVLPH